MKGATVYAGAQRLVLREDRELPAARAGERSVFIVEPLSERDRFRMLDEQTIRIRRPDDLVETIDRGYAQALDVCLLCLRGAENFPADKPVPYPVDGTVEQKVAYIAQLTVAGVYELGQLILTAAYAQAAEKN